MPAAVPAATFKNVLRSCIFPPYIMAAGISPKERTGKAGHLPRCGSVELGLFFPRTDGRGN
jgi:hypothetical protein